MSTCPTTLMCVRHQFSIFSRQRLFHTGFLLLASAIWLAVKDWWEVINDNTPQSAAGALGNCPECPFDKHEWVTLSADEATKLRNWANVSGSLHAQENSPADLDRSL